MQEYLCIGVIAKPQGVRGELKIEPYVDDIKRFNSLKRVFIKQKDSYQLYEVLSARCNESFGFVRLKGIDDRNAAEAFREMELYVHRDDAVVLSEGRYFIADLIGCEVSTNEGEILGVVDEILQNGGNDVYVVKAAHGEVLFPAIKALFLTVDVLNSRIIVDAKRLAEVAVYED